MKNIFILGILIMPLFILTTTSMIDGQIENTINITNTSSNDLSVNIGKLILESKTHGEGIKIADIDKQTIEVYFSGNGTLEGNVTVMDIGTSWSTLKNNGYWYSKGEGMILTLDNEIAKYTFQSIGKHDNDGKLRNLGSVTFYTDSIGELSVLKNTIGVYADEIDQQGNAITKVWKLNK
jgi:hypothetical protein